MKFSNFQKLYFDALDGAFSVVTKTEATDPQITIDRTEKSIIWQRINDSSIFRGSRKKGGAAADKQFRLWPSGQVIKIPLVYPRPKKTPTQLRLYPTKQTGFTVRPFDVWFVFIKQGDKLPWLASKSKRSWAELGREDEDDKEYVTSVQDCVGLKSRAKRVKALRRSRNERLGARCLKRAGFKCEASAAHPIFKARATGKGYVEPHHLLPVSLQQRDRFKKLTLDSLENVYALCPDCHARVHHAQCPEVAKVIDALLALRPAILTRFKITRAEILTWNGC